MATKAKTLVKKDDHSLEDKVHPLLKDIPLIVTLLRKSAMFEILSIFYFSDEPVRFKKIEECLPGISNTTITYRLSYLCSKGILKRTRYNERPPRVDYTLTKKGKHVVSDMSGLLVNHTK